MSMVWAVDGEAVDAAEGGGGVVAKWHAMVTVMQHKVGRARKIWALQDRHSVLRALRRAKAGGMEAQRVVKPLCGSAGGTGTGASKSVVPEIGQRVIRPMCRQEKEIQWVVVKSLLGSTEWTGRGVSKSGVPKIYCQFEETLVKVNRKNKVDGQHSFVAILGTPIDVPK